jgi:BirA family transcriptional regulator, biotin operon repressor / biotin---[acetyl-CoA-carboxylase] ligase
LNIRILDRLRAVPGDYVPLSELGPNLEQVRDDLSSLVSFGFGIEQHPYRGAAYIGPAERLCPDQIEHELATRWLGRRIVVWNRVTSTNDLAARAGTSVSNDGLVILAEEQTSGRGRRGRSWTAPPRSSILMSVLLFPPRHLMPGDSAGAVERTWLTALGAVAAAEVISAWTGRDARIKWPNDVRLDGRKIAGILVERALAPTPPADSRKLGALSQRAWGALIGIGLNANLARDDFPLELAPLATSLQIERRGAPVDRSELARELIRRLDHWYDLSRRGGALALSSAWCQRSEHLGRAVRVETASASVVGRLVDLDVRFGVTLEPCRATGSHHQEARVGPPLDLSEQTLRRIDGDTLSEFTAERPERSLPPLVKLALADIRSIEPFNENRTAFGTDPDSRPQQSGSERSTVLD